MARKKCYDYIREAVREGKRMNEISLRKRISFDLSFPALFFGNSQF